jgi:hypothetical protein
MAVVFTIDTELFAFIEGFYLLIAIMLVITAVITARFVRGHSAFIFFVLLLCVSQYLPVPGMTTLLQLRHLLHIFSGVHSL